MSRLNTGYTAGGTINPCRFVKLSTVTDRHVLQAGDNEQVYGVAQEWTRDTPGLTGAGTDAAAATETITVYEAGDVAQVEAGGAITRGSNVKSDSDGKAVAAATTGTTMQWIAGQALESASGAGVKILVKIHPMPHYPALA